MASVTVQALTRDALMEVGALAEGESPSASLASFVLGRLNQIVDNWNAQREAVYTEQFPTFTFVPNQQEYTIGPTGDFVVDSRPVSIEGGNVILDNVSPAVQNPIQIRDWQWWLGLSVRAVTTTFPTDCYYTPDWPNGTLRFWPVPTVAYGLELAVRGLLGELDRNSTINLPPGYHNALMLTLAESISTPLGRPLQQATMLAAREARNRIYINNDVSLRLETQDSGMPSNSRNRCTFNYRTGVDFNVNR